MEGWISLHRQITEHWIWQDPVKFKWWIDLILLVNHNDAKVNIGFELFECKRGQSILSLKSWGERWGVSKDTVRNFFVLLAKDNMITIENLVKTTRITICNYDTYQSNLHTEQTQSKRKANAKQTQPHPNNNENTNNTDNKRIEKAENPIFEKVKSNFLIPNEECKKLFLADELHCYRITKNLGISNDVLKYWLDEFFIALEIEGKTEKSIMDTKSHFGRWLPIKLNKQNGQKTATYDPNIKTYYD